MSPMDMRLKPTSRTGSVSDSQGFADSNDDDSDDYENSVSSADGSEESSSVIID